MAVAVEKPMALALLALSIFAFATASSTSVTTGHPIDDVIGMLKKLHDQADSEHKNEEQTYVKFKYWCDNSKKALNKAVASGKESKSVLEDKMASASKAIEVFQQDIEKLQGELEKLDAAGAAADSERESGAKLYDAESSSLAGTVEAIDSALTMLSETKGSVEGSLIQTGSHRQARKKVALVFAMVAGSATAAQRAVFQDWLDTDSDDSPERPELKAEGDRDRHVKTTSFKSDSVIELLKKLKADFENKHTETVKAETNAINAYKLAKAARTELKRVAQESKDTKEKGLALEQSNLADHQASHADVVSDLQADSDSLKSTTHDCETKKNEWNDRSTARAGEKEALNKAVEILGKATGVRTEAPGNPVPPPAPVQFLQTWASHPRTQKALNLVREQAKTHHSKALEHLADLIAAKGDKGPFDDVVNSIQKMIFRLKQEQKDEDDHKNWCDQEISKTGASISKKTDKKEELNTKMEEHQAKAMMLLEESNEATDMVKEIQDFQKKAVEIRRIGKEENAKAVEDADKAQTALANAVAVLTDFYKSTGAVKKEAYELLQEQRGPLELNDRPSTWDSSYQSVEADPSAGIIGILKKVQTGFAEMEAKTLAQEANDQDQHDNVMKTHEIEKARRVKEAEMKKQERARVLQKHTQMKGQLKNVEGELFATHQYMKDLDQPCRSGGSMYEDRKAARLDEIMALGQAQKLLQNAFNDADESDAKFLQVQEADGYKKPAAVGFLAVHRHAFA